MSAKTTYWCRKMSFAIIYYNLCVMASSSTYLVDCEGFVVVTVATFKMWYGSLLHCSICHKMIASLATGVAVDSEGLLSWALLGFLVLCKEKMGMIRFFFFKWWKTVINPKEETQFSDIALIWDPVDQLAQNHHKTIEIYCYFFNLSVTRKYMLSKC